MTISIHTLREEGDAPLTSSAGRPSAFLSTPSARRATRPCLSVSRLVTGFLSTPSARRATSTMQPHEESKCHFYPHPPRGGRLVPLFVVCSPIGFLSTPSARRATAALNGNHAALLISIHTLREEGDRRRPNHERQVHYFYPHPPRGGRQQKQRENPLLLSHYTPPCTNCKEMSANQTAKSHRYLRKRLVFRCEASRKTMCAAGSHWPDIKKSARCLEQTPGAVQRARPWSGSCCPIGRTADCPRQGRSGRSALL